MNTKPTFVILAAEDDEDDRFLLSEAFARHQPGCQLQFFQDGQQLLDALAEQETSPLPAVILLDLNMPVLNGLDTLKLLKADVRLRQVPVLMLTTSNRDEDIEQCYAAGANAYMTKPSTYSELARQLDCTLQYWLKTVQLPSGR
ncbi:response regulator [Larkinella sp. C7]|uniref:response regulator n=1 Tax=Larkinella sp. C7 TaxID=2576607 RepID=UPI0011114BD3|nr:response regulator [Larkinella sp. C7]